MLSREPERQPSRRAHADGDRIRGHTRSRASVHGRRRFLPGAQRLAVEPVRQCAACSNRAASVSKPTTTPRLHAASWNGACAKATNCESALQKGFEELDGFYTFLMGTPDKLALIRDPFACKPAVVAETDDYVAIASEFRSLAHLPDVKNALRVRTGSGGDVRMETSELRSGAAHACAQLNQFLHHGARRTARSRRYACSIPMVRTTSPSAWIAPSRSNVQGHAGYYVGGMNKLATVHHLRQRRDRAWPRT